MVKKGETVGELDSAALRDSLINQKITTESAKANFDNAKLAQDAESALQSYRTDIAPRNSERSTRKRRSPSSSWPLPRRN